MISAIKSQTGWAGGLVVYLDHDVGTLSVVAHDFESERGFGREWMRRRGLEERLLSDFSFLNPFRQSQRQLPSPAYPFLWGDSHLSNVLT